MKFLSNEGLRYDILKDDLLEVKEKYGMKEESIEYSSSEVVSKI